MKNSPKISESEWQVMQVIWKKSPITTNEVVKELTPKSRWKPKTIMTLLNRLVKKGALRFEKDGRAYEYYPLISENECVKAKNRSFLKRVYGGALKPMLADFLEDAELTDQEIAELKSMLDKGNSNGKVS